MKIEANLGYSSVGNGIKLPEYLVRVTHKEVMLLGARNFEIGEQLLGLSVLDRLADAVNGVRQTYDSMEDVLKVFDANNVVK